MAQQDDSRIRQDALRRPGQQGPVSAASGGTRSRSGSNYGDWHPDTPPQTKGYDGSSRSGDWPEGDKDAAGHKEAAQELKAPTAPATTGKPPPDKT